jgi:signal transduction histidine kinase
MTCTPASLDLPAFCRHVAKEIESAAARDGAIQFAAMGVDNDASADEGLLHHVLANILGNAVKYSAPNQKVEFILRRRGLDAEFVVRDFGCGIPVADQSRLFTAFYRGSNVGHTPGSGLGLVIAKRCVDLHGGSIRCESKPGFGTKFTVTLPLFDGTRVFRRRPTDSSEPAKSAVTESTLSPV